jgi:hypothetical protein
VSAPKPAQRRRRSIPPKAREKFLEALRAGWSVTHAATRAGHARQRFYESRERDEEFALAWEEAVEAGTDRLEDEAFRRAVEGYDEDTFDGDGNLIRRVRKYDNATIQALLKGRRPDKYREGTTLELSATVNQLHIAPDPERTARVLEKLREVGLLTHVPEAQVLELTEGEGE